MKTQKKKSPIKKVLAVVFMVLMIIPFTSHAKKYPFLTSSVVPGAKGYVKVKTDKNKNYNIKVEVSDLAKVERVNSSKNTYVVWMETEDGRAENMGQLKSSTGFLSRRHNASLETVTPFKPVKIFITTENGTNERYPGEQEVLSTEKFSVK
jgi:hypothetical protein